MTLTPLEQLEQRLRREALAARLCIYADRLEAWYRSPDAADKRSASLMREAAAELTADDGKGLTMTEPRTFRAGDVVAHGPSGESWVLACDEFVGSVWPAGWPESRASAADCVLVTPASDAERLEMLTRAAAIKGADYRVLPHRPAFDPRSVLRS